jgi:hypothetical protein
MSDAKSKLKDTRVARFFGPNIPKRKNIPNDYKLYQKAVNYTMAAKYSKR